MEDDDTALNMCRDKFEPQLLAVHPFSSSDSHTQILLSQELLCVHQSASGGKKYASVIHINNKQ